MPYITPEDMTPGMKLLMTDVAEFIAYAIGTTTDHILHPFQDDNHTGARVRQVEVIDTTPGMLEEFGDDICYMVTLKVPGQAEPVNVPMSDGWMIRQPLSTTY